MQNEQDGGILTENAKKYWTTNFWRSNEDIAAAEKKQKQDIAAAEEKQKQIKEIYSEYEEIHIPAPINNDAIKLDDKYCNINWYIIKNPDSVERMSLDYALQNLKIPEIINVGKCTNILKPIHFYDKNYHFTGYNYFVLLFNNDSEKHDIKDGYYYKTEDMKIDGGQNRWRTKSMRRKGGGGA